MNKWISAHCMCTRTHCVPKPTRNTEGLIEQKWYLSWSEKAYGIGKTDKTQTDYKSMQVIIAISNEMKKKFLCYSIQFNCISCTEITTISVCDYIRDYYESEDECFIVFVIILLFLFFFFFSLLLLLLCLLPQFHGRFIENGKY